MPAIPNLPIEKKLFIWLAALVFLPLYACGPATVAVPATPPPYESAPTASAPEILLCSPPAATKPGVHAGMKGAPLPAMSAIVVEVVDPGPPVRLKETDLESRFVGVYYSGIVGESGNVQPVEGEIQELYVGGKEIALVSSDISTGCIETKEYGSLPILFSANISWDYGMIVVSTGQLEQFRKFSIAQAPGPTATAVDSSSALRVKAYWEKDAIVVGKDKSALSLQVFGFDPQQKITASPGGIKLESEDSPPMVLYNMGAGFSGSLYMDYANIILDLTQLPETAKSDFEIARQYTTDGNIQCNIMLNFEKLTETFISPEYIVFPNQDRNMDGNGPFVSLTLQADAGVSGTLVLFRNGIEIGRIDMAVEKESTFILEGTKGENDVIEWRLEGDKAQQGAFGFPMSGSVPDLVEYIVNVGNMVVQSTAVTPLANEEIRPTSTIPPPVVEIRPTSTIPPPVVEMRPTSTIPSTNGEIRLFHGKGILEMAFSPDGKRIATSACAAGSSGGPCQGEIQVWEAATGTSFQLIADLPGRAYDLAWDTNGRHIIAAICREKDQDDPLVCHSVVILGFDANTGEVTAEFNIGPVNSKVYAARFAPGGGIFALPTCTLSVNDQCEASEIQLWEISAKKIIQSFTGYPDWISTLAFSPDARLLAASPGEGIWIWNVATGEKTSAYLEFFDEGLPMAWSPDKVLASATCEGFDGYICELTTKLWLWDHETDRLRQSFDLDLVWIDDMAWSPDGSVLAIAGCRSINMENLECTDPRVYFWNSQTSEMVGDYPGDVWQLRFSPDGQNVAFLIYATSDVVMKEMTDVIRLP